MDSRVSGIGGMELTGTTEVLGAKPILVPLRPLQT